MKRLNYSDIAAQTVSVLNDGIYESCSGDVVDITKVIADGIAQTVCYSPDDDIMFLKKGSYNTSFSVKNVTTLKAGHDLTIEGLNPVLLNFASARNPGGGFLQGSLAQEESIARVSSLYSCIKDQPMYEYYSIHRTPLYDDWVIYSPKVVVFREEAISGSFLDVPWVTAVITSPAPNATAYKEKCKQAPVQNLINVRKETIENAIYNVFKSRAIKVLSVAQQQHDSIVLGAWGCGVFGCDPKIVSKIFFDLLVSGPFKDSFKEVVFAILDNSPDKKMITPFMELFDAKDKRKLYDALS